MVSIYEIENAKTVKALNFLERTIISEKNRIVKNKEFSQSIKKNALRVYRRKYKLIRKMKRKM